MPLHLSPTQRHQGAASWVISSPADELGVSHHWAFSPSELDSADPTNAPGLDLPSSRHWSDGCPLTGQSEPLAQGCSRKYKHRSRGRAPRAGWAWGSGKVLQTLYLLSVTCLRRGMRLVSLCTAGWLLKSGFLVVLLIRHRMTVTTMQAMKNTPMQYMAISR